MKVFFGRYASIPPAPLAAAGNRSLRVMRVCLLHLTPSAAAWYGARSDAGSRGKKRRRDVKATPEVEGSDIDQVSSYPMHHLTNSLSAWRTIHS